MANLGTFRVNETDLLPSQSGNGILALYNIPGSNKRIYIKNVEIQNFRRDSIGTNTRVTDWVIRKISALSGGNSVPVTKLDTNATNLPSQIQVIKGGSPTLVTQSVPISTTTTIAFAVGPPGTLTRAAGSFLTDGIIPGTQINVTGSSSNNTGTITLSSLGNLTFTSTTRTIVRSSGSWITDGIMPNARITISGTTNNNKTFTVLTRDSATQITCITTDVLINEGPVAATATCIAATPFHIVRSTTATVLTVETQYPVTTEAAVAATLTASKPVELHKFCTRHNFFATTSNAQFNHFNTGQKRVSSGSMYNRMRNISANIDPITLAEGEGISIVMPRTLDLDAATDTKEFHTYLVEGTFSVDFVGGDRTFFFTDYMTPNGEDSPLFSIMNNTGSGQNVKILDISVSEIGDTSTPYFMLVPFDYIEPQQYADTYRDLPYVKMDTNYSAIDSFVKIKTDVSLFPKGFSTGGALFPLSFGSSVPAAGLNYLITKDYLGPIFSAYFTEKSELVANPTTAVTKHLTTQSQRDDTIFKGNDLYLSEGEGLAIVAASEPLTGVGAGTANQVNKFSMGKYDYSVTFSVVDVTVDLVLTGLASGSEVKVFLHNTTTELATNTIPNTDTSFTWSYVYTASYYVDIVIMHLNYNYYRIDNLLLTSTGSTIPVQQILDRNYSNPV